MSVSILFGCFYALRMLYLHIMSLGTNAFSGTIPKELGSLLDLRMLWASDNLFTGKIPDFISNWTKLMTLRLQGNSFEGPIPSSFSRLTSMTDMRISELSNVSSSLDFIKDMKYLSHLVLTLRNSMISGSIPSYFGEFQNLERLDLSFNNLTGSIPSSLFNLDSVSHLFLGNNTCLVTFPPKKPNTYQYVRPSDIFISYGEYKCLVK
ncbi:hypothetical protein HHK36_004743 [Tetracentron sinense]|uniref:Uncharacterized protein n=1 Tax=Tetracentron sinense TaxID=13715 RepID=A0A834ZJN5_TETSI|nr:hypothetical protein HHK36_004743 [Tetracentron sinense]